jgi:hypothetical protein
MMGGAARRGAFLVFRLRSFAWEMPENGLV